MKKKKDDAFLFQTCDNKYQKLISRLSNSWKSHKFVDSQINLCLLNSLINTRNQMLKKILNTDNIGSQAHALKR